MKSLALTLLVLLCCIRLQAEVITHWNFNSAIPDNDATTGTYSPKIGSGTAVKVGTVLDSFTAGTGSSDTWADNSNWRLNNWPAQGTGNKTSGVEFRVSTSGQKNIRLEWDQRASNTASRYARLQYSTNGTHFIDHDVITTIAEQFITYRSDLSAIPGVNDNANFAFRVVIEFESTATGSGTAGYVAANSPHSNYGAAGSTQRFDMVTVFGDPLVHAQKTFTLFNYNVWGANTTEWNTNTAQVRAFGRQVAHLQPDIIAFQEIPNIGLHQMTNFVHAFLPGYYWATNRTADGDKGNMILSRFPILRSKSNLGRVSLNEFGFNGVFTRDLFEAEIAVPGWSEPVHAFSVHLKAFNDEVSAPRRAAEASAISNFFVNTFRPYNGHRAYVVAGDFNEDIDRPRSYEQGAIQRISNPQTDLRLTRPVDPYTDNERTWSSQNPSATIRFDYIFPSGSLFSNIVSSRIFRTDKLNPLPSGLLANDSQIASDHLPILMTFQAPYRAPENPIFSLKSAQVTNQTITLQWNSVVGQKFRVLMTANFTNWIDVSGTITASGTNTVWSGSILPTSRFYRIQEVK